MSGLPNTDNDFTKAFQGLSSILEQAVSNSLKEESKNENKQENREETKEEVSSMAKKNKLIKPNLYMLETLIETQKILCELLQEHKKK